MSDQCAAGEHRRLSIKLPNRVTIDLCAGHYGYSGYRPVWFKAERGGRVCMAKNPLTAVMNLLKYEKEPLRPI